MSTIYTPSSNPTPGQATIRIVLELDGNAVRSFLQEGHASLVGIAEMANGMLKDRLETMREVEAYKLKDGKSYNMTFKIDLMDTAISGESKSPRTRLKMVLEE